MEIFVYLFGFIFAIIIPFYPINKVVDQLWLKITGFDFKSKYCDYSPRYGSKNHINLAGITGCLERTLYTTSLLLGKPEFIGVWLALKVAGQWDLWKGETEYNGVKIIGRSVFQIFLIGNALSIMYAITGAKLIDWSLNGAWIFAVCVPLSLLISTFILWYLIGTTAKS